MSSPALVFVAVPGSSASQTLRAPFITPTGEGQATSAARPTATAATLAALSLAAVATAAGKAVVGARGKRATTSRRAEPKFAGGLIGGESAFSSFDYNFDPLGLVGKCPQFLPWFRESELKHGRVAMIAWVGLVFPEIARIPGPEKCYTAGTIDAHNACVGEDNLGPLFQIFMFCGFIEMLSTFPKCTQGLTLENAGDYRLGLSFLPKEENKVTEMKLKELKNGRLAMLAFGGAITQAALSGNGFPWLYATQSERSSGSGFAVTTPMAGTNMVRMARVAMRAENSYKMSKAVPFLPISPALAGYVGEEDGFDPMGVSLAIDIGWLRESELKHGRVAMLATVGWIATDLGTRIPGEPFQVSTIDAHDAMVKFGAMPQMLCWIGYAELFGFLAINNMMEGRTLRREGDFGLRFLYPKDEQAQYDMQLKELRNGRLAMLAFGGIVTAAVLTGKTWPFFAANGEQNHQNNMSSTLCGGFQRLVARCESVRARGMETSKSLPFMPKPENLAGFVGEEQEFDPLGFSDTFDMKWLRESELKHGRVCMLASVGFFAQQYITIPGTTPTPDALQAVYTAPPAAMATLLFLAGYIESASHDGKLTMLDMFDGKDREPGNFNFGTGFLNSKAEKDIRDIKLKELNNGRLAMMAIGGMVHHNLVVKGPLFPVFPEHWMGPQGSWELESVMGRL